MRAGQPAKVWWLNVKAILFLRRFRGVGTEVCRILPVVAAAPEFTILTSALDHVSTALLANGNDCITLAVCAFSVCLLTRHKLTAFRACALRVFTIWKVVAADKRSMLRLFDMEVA